MKIENLMSVRDVITGFTGRVMGVCHYATGCDQALVSSPDLKPDGESVSKWFDVERLEIVEGEPLVLPGNAKGELKGGPSTEPEPPLK